MSIKNGKLIGFTINIIFLGLLNPIFLKAQNNIGYFEQNGQSIISIRAEQGIRVKGAICEKIADSLSQKMLVIPAKMDTLIIYPEDDAYISVWNRNTNYGSETYLDVLGKGGRSRGRYICCSPAYEFVSYLRFQLPQIQGEIVSAYLNLFCNSGGYLGGIFYLNPIESNLNWDEKTITWNNRPNPLDDPQTFLAYRGNVPIHRWSIFDVTRAFENNWPSYTFVVAMQKSNSTEWSSKEGEHKPYLKILYVRNAPPYIVDIEYNHISPESVSFVWSTNVPTNSEFFYGVDKSNLTTSVVLSEISRLHAIEIDRLLPDRTYFYKIVVHDQMGQSYASQIDSFYTEKIDSLAPHITIFLPKNHSITANLSTPVVGKILDSDVSGVDINGHFYKLNSDSTFQAVIQLQEGLNPIIITAKDFSGNTSKDTLFVVRDTTPPHLIVQKLASISAKTAIISWRANEKASAYLTYGLHSGVEDTVMGDTLFSTNGELRLPNLSPETTYQYFIDLSDPLHNLSQWGPYSFKTNKSNRIEASLEFRYLGQSYIPIDTVLVDLYVDGQLAKVDTAVSGKIYEPNIVFTKTCFLDWKKIGGLSDDSSIQMYDAALAALYSVGKRQLDSLNVIAADVDRSGQVMMYDAAQIARFSVGLGVPKSSHVGEWLFKPDSIAIDTPDSSHFNQSIMGILLGDVNGDWRPESHLAKKTNFQNEEWLKSHLSIYGDTLLVIFSFNELNEKPHYSFSMNLDYDKKELRYLGYLQKNRFPELNIFQNTTTSGLKLGGFSTNPINDNSIQFKFVVNTRRDFIKIKNLSFALNNEQIICSNQKIYWEQTKYFPKEFRLFQNYPNPFNGNTRIQYSIPGKGLVTIIIYNQRGERVKQLVKKELRAGLHQIYWNGTDDAGQKISSGLYFVRLSFNGQERVNKLLYLK